MTMSHLSHLLVTLLSIPVLHTFSFIPHPSTTILQQHQLKLNHPSIQKQFITPAQPTTSPFIKFRPLHNSLTNEIHHRIEHTAIAGKIFPLINRIINADLSKISKSVDRVVDFNEIFFMATLAYSIPYLAKLIYKKMKLNEHKFFSKKKFYTSNLFHITNHISQGFKISICVYIVDCLSAILQAIGFRNMFVKNMGWNFATISFTFWSMMRFKMYKLYAFRRFVFRGQAERIINFYDRVSNIILYFLTTLITLDLLGVNYGAALKTLYAFGGAGTIVISLAFKDIAAQCLSGLSLSLTETIQPGDKVVIGEKTVGVVERVGLFHTVIRGPDEIETEIPNSQIDKQRISNISEGKFSQVKQVLRFKYSSLSKIPALLRDIKSEIKKSCPLLITDGSRPFRVNWTEYGSNYLEVTVDTRFKIQPDSDEYHHNREQVLEAIGRAVERCQVDFL